MIHELESAIGDLAKTVPAVLERFDEMSELCATWSSIAMNNAIEVGLLTDQVERLKRALSSSLARSLPMDSDRLEYFNRLLEE